MSQISGDQSLQVQPLRYGFGESGSYAYETHESTNRAQVDAKAAWAASNGLFYDVEHGFGKSKIVIRYNYNFAQNKPSSQDVWTEWELIPLKTEVSLLDARNPLTYKLLNGIDGGTPAELSVIKKIVERDSLDQLYVGGVFYQPAGISSTPATLLLKYLFDGQKTMRVDLPALKKSLTVNSDYVSRLAFPANVTLYSTPTLITDFSFPTTSSGWGASQVFSPLFNLPSGDTGLILDTLGGTGIVQTLGWGWLMDTPEAARVGRNKWKINYSWQYGLYGLDIYGGRL